MKDSEMSDNRHWKDWVGNTYSPDTSSYSEFERNKLLAAIADALEGILEEMRKEHGPQII